MKELTKKMKQHLRALIGVAYERELSHHLKELAKSFNGWEANKMDCWELSGKIHEFHQGISRELYNLYTYPVDLILLVRRAIAKGFLLEHEVSPEVLEIITEATPPWASLETDR